MQYEFTKSRNQYAIGILDEFFDYYGLNQSLNYTELLFYYALHQKCYKEREPYTMIFLGDWLKQLINAAFVLQEEFRFSDVFTVELSANQLPDLERKKDFMPERPGFEWQYIPRHVNAGQYSNPVKALKKMSSYKTAAEWNKVINDLVEYTLCNCSIDDSSGEYNILRIRLILLQTIEACYLLLVRYTNNATSADTTTPPPVVIQQPTQQ